MSKLRASFLKVMKSNENREGDRHKTIIHGGMRCCKDWINMKRGRRGGPTDE